MILLEVNVCPEKMLGEVEIMSQSRLSILIPLDPL